MFCVSLVNPRERRFDWQMKPAPFHGILNWINDRGSVFFIKNSDASLWKWIVSPSSGDWKSYLASKEGKSCKLKIYSMRRLHCSWSICYSLHRNEWTKDKGPSLFEWFESIWWWVTRSGHLESAFGAAFGHLESAEYPFSIKLEGLLWTIMVEPVKNDSYSIEPC